MKGQQVWAARLVDRGDEFWFASVDGESFVEVNVDPSDVPREDIQRIIDGRWRNEERHGQMVKVTTKPLQFARRWLRQRGAIFSNPDSEFMNL